MNQKILTEEMETKIGAMFEEQHRIFNDIFKCIDSINSQLCDIRTNNQKIAEKNKKEIPELSQDERAILRNIDREYEWIARNQNNELRVFDKRVYHCTNSCWASPEEVKETVLPTTNLFSFIKYENEDAYRISDLLGE